MTSMHNLGAGICTNNRCTGNDYRLCDYCGEHDCHLVDQPRYYNYGFSKRIIRMCLNCTYLF